MEGIHQEMYSTMIDTFITNEAEKSELFHAIDNFPCIQKKALWAKKWISSTKGSFASTSSYAHRLVAFACVEGLFFSGSFAAIFWIKKRGLMPGLTFSNELISRDESLHTDFAVLMYKKINSIHRLPKELFYELIKDAVAIETEFIIESLPCRLIGMNSGMMTQYIEFVADRLCVQLGYDKCFNKINPFQFMELQSVEGKANFFERTVSSYALATKDSGDHLFAKEDEVVDF
jgi:ribonucleotide reductase beta subunit family protein with ferritin-like domain